MRNKGRAVQVNKHLGKLADEINLYVFHSNDCFSFITNKVDTTYHKHYYIQLTIGLEKQFKCQFDDATYNIRGILIGSNVNHKLIGHNEWQLYMLINPESTLGELIKSKWLLSSEHILLTDDIVNDIVHIIPNKMAGDQYKLFFEKMKKILGKESYQQSNRDERIMRLIQYIDDHSLDELSVKKLSNVVILSESRLSHLFKEQIGISLTS